LGVRVFGTQLLCEQVIGRALRRQSYDLNEEGLFNVEYADVLGVPFDFTAKPAVVPPQPPRETIQVKAMRPERDHLEIRFPRVQGYRIENPPLADRRSALSYQLGHSRQRLGSRVLPCGQGTPAGAGVREEP
jgi:type III restriction enzyme